MVKFESIYKLHSQKFAMDVDRYRDLGAKPPSLENFVIFAKNNLILGLF